MSKDKISDYSTTASNNTDIAGIGIQGTNAVSNFDGAFRTIMKQLADMNAGTSPIFDTFTLCDPADNTKLVRIDAGNVTAGQTRVISVPDASTTIVGTDTTQTITNKTFTDNVTTFADNGDATKKAQFDCAGITTATTRTYTLPNASSTIAVLGLAQTWSASQTFSSTTQFGDLIAKTADNSTLAIYGGTAGLGAHITLAGSTHATVANQGFYDANTHSFRQVGGSGTPSVNIGGNTVWHAGNDGTGSGLDADVLRGLAPDTSATVSTIMQRDGSGNTSVAQLTATALNYSSALTIGDGGEDFRFNADGFLSNGLTVTKTDITDSGTGLSFQKAGIIWASRSAAALMFLNRDGSDGIVAQFARGKTAVGSISVTTTNTAYNTSSDGRAKINRQPLANSGDVLDALQPLTWDWNHVEGEHGVGFIAQDLHAIVPEAVTPGDGDPSLKPGEKGFEWWSLDMSKLVPYLVAEVKSLRSRVATLEGE